MSSVSSVSNQTPIRGCCLCRAIEFQALSVGVPHACHCSDCRRHHGAAFHAVPVDNFRLTKGKLHLREYVSSEWACRGFCTLCGSGLYYRTQDQTFYGVSLGCIETPQPPLHSHIYVESAEVSPDHPDRPDIWDDLPRLTGAEFLRSEGLEELADMAAMQTPPPIASITDGHSGGCHCGGVRFRVSGTLRPLLVCHCGQCQKQASGYYRATEVEKADFLLEQQGSLRWYASSDDAERGFCGECGSILFWRLRNAGRQATGREEAISIQAGTFDERLPLPVKEHIFTGDASGAIPLPQG